MFNECNDVCGFFSAMLGALMYGSYGVPIKATLDIEVHPLVLQTYKSVVLFCVCWMVLLFGETIKFTPFGLLSGLLWVLGGTFGIFAIRNAGMAVAVGTWSSVMVLCNFFWGILVFQEPVHSLLSTCIAFFFLGLGLIGMSKYSSVQSSSSSSTLTLTSLTTKESSSLHVDIDGDTENSHDILKPKPEIKELELIQPKKAQKFKKSTPRKRSVNDDDKKQGEDDEVVPLKHRDLEGLNNNHTTTTSNNNDRNDKKMMEGGGIIHIGDNINHNNIDNNNDDDDAATKMKPVVIFAGIPLTKRQAGITCAVCNGILAGSSLVPLHFAKAQGFGGLSYIISFGTGAFISQIIVWACFLVYHYCSSNIHLLYRRQQQHQRGGGRHHRIRNNDDDDNNNNNNNHHHPSHSPKNSIVDSLSAAAIHTGSAISSALSSTSSSSSSSSFSSFWEFLPEFHIKLLWKRGLLAGLLLAFGMFGSIEATTVLGQGVGNSLVQSKIIISGLWGIFWFQEITEPTAIMKWFASACLTVASILWLTYERVHAAKND